MQREIKQKKQDLGIFYTDKRIVNFIFDILKIWKEKQDKETGRWIKKGHHPSVVDPAVGEGIFLKIAIESGFTKTDWVFGLDIDEDIVKKWKEINLLKEFGGKEEDLTAHFFHQNGLDKIQWEQHIDKYKYKLKQEDIIKQQFDTVVGNPPYGGIGVDFKGKLTPENRKLLDVLHDFEIFGFKKNRHDIEEVDPNGKKHYSLTLLEQISLKDDLEIAKNSVRNYQVSLEDAMTMSHGMPIEILFLERFIQLAKPEGWIAIIIPDGILTNSNSHYVREFISKKVRVEAIVSLPRDAFKNVGTSAKTSILFLQKYKDQGEKRDLNYPVFLASIESLEEKYFKIIKDAYKKHYTKI